MTPEQKMQARTIEFAMDTFKTVAASCSRLMVTVKGFEEQAALSSMRKACLEEANALLGYQIREIPPLKDLPFADND